MGEGLYIELVKVMKILGLSRRAMNTLFENGVFQKHQLVPNGTVYMLREELEAHIEKVRSLNVES